MSGFPVIYTNKEDASSPTVSIEAMVLSCAINAKENRYVVVSDIPGAFLHADMEENVHMLLQGTVAEMIVKLDPSMYKKHIWYNKGANRCYTYNLKSTIWDATSCTAFLEITVRDITGMGFRPQSIRQMHGKQGYSR